MVKGINKDKQRGYRLVKRRGIITIIRPSVMYRMMCEKCRRYAKERDPSKFSGWVETDTGALCEECAGKVGE